jgi:hypothetical protein
VALLWHIPGAAQSFQQEEEDTGCSKSTTISEYSYRYRSSYRKGKAPEAVESGNAALMMMMMMSWVMIGAWDMAPNGHNVYLQEEFCNRG